MSCDERFYAYNNSCLPCPELCQICDLECKQCVINSNFTENKTCACNEGFEVIEKSCQAKYFYASLYVSSINLLFVNFSEATKDELIEDNFEIYVGNRTDFKWSLVKAKDKIEYWFRLSFEKAVNNGTVIQVFINESILLSLNGSQLKDYRIYNVLPGYSPINPSIKVILNSTAAAAQAVVSTSVGASLVSNPAAAWALLNSIQILIFLPLNRNNMTENVRAFLSGFSGYNILPNLFK